MKKELWYSEEKINEVMKALSKKGYKPILKEPFDGSNIVVYVETYDDLDILDNIIDPILDGQSYFDWWDYGEAILYIGCYISNIGEIPENPIIVRTSDDFPNDALKEIFVLWKRLTEQVPDGGCCYFPDSVTLKYNDKYYKLYPMDYYQGAARRQFWHYIQPIIEVLGCTEITYNAGSID